MGLEFLGDTYKSLELRLEDTKDFLHDRVSNLENYLSNWLNKHKQKIGLSLVAGVLVLSACSSKPGPIPTQYPISPTTQETPRTITPSKPTGEYLDITVYELMEKLSDNRLSSEQRKEMWTNQYQGRKVRLLGEVDHVYYSGSFVTFLYSKSDSSKFEVLAELSKSVSGLDKEGIVFFTGTIENYGYSGDKIGRELFIAEMPTFALTNSRIESPVLKTLWSRSAPTVRKDLSGMFRDDPTLIGVDSHYMYSLDPLGPVDFGKKEAIFVLDKTNGYYVSETTAASTSYVDKVRSMADAKFVLSKLPLQLKMDGLSLEVARHAMKFYDARSGKLLYNKGTSLTIHGAVVDNDMLFLSSYAELYAFRLVSQNKR